MGKAHKRPVRQEVIQGLMEWTCILLVGLFGFWKLFCLYLISHLNKQTIVVCSIFIKK